MELNEFDDLFAKTRQTLLNAYGSAQGFWSLLSHMCEQVEIHRRRLAYSIDLVTQLPGHLLDVGSNAAFACMYATRRKGPTTLINYGHGGGADLQCNDIVLPVRLLDIQRDDFPFADGTFDSVLFLEVVEHLSVDPMRTMSEINRVTRTNGALLMTTPNIISYRSIAQAIAGKHPHLSSKYLKDDCADRHNREYTPEELSEMVRSSGYAIEWSETPSVYTTNEFTALAAMLKETDQLQTRRGDTIAIRGRKTGQVEVRYPPYLYF